MGKQVTGIEACICDEHQVMDESSESLILYCMFILELKYLVKQQTNKKHGSISLKAPISVAVNSKETCNLLTAAT